LRTEEIEELDCSLVVHAVGYAGRPVAGLPFDEVNAHVPHDQGRVVDAGVPVSGVYVVGWAKRGPSGVIGTNKACAEETVRSLLADAAEGRLRPPREPHADLAARLSGAVDLDSWRRLDLVEREAGRAAGRPRVKISDRDRMLAFVRP